MHATAARALAPFARQYTILLTTYRRDGTPVGTPVNLAVEGDHGYFRTWHTAWKARRLARNPRIELAPSTLRGRPTGPAMRATAAALEGAEAEHAAHALARKHPLLHGLMVPLLHRLKGVRTVHYRVTPTV